MPRRHYCYRPQWIFLKDRGPMPPDGAALEGGRQCIGETQTCQSECEREGEQESSVEMTSILILASASFVSEVEMAIDEPFSGPISEVCAPAPLRHSVRSASASCTNIWLHRAFQVACQRSRINGPGSGKVRFRPLRTSKTRKKRPTTRMKRRFRAMRRTSICTMEA